LAGKCLVFNLRLNLSKHICDIHLYISFGRKHGKLCGEYLFSDNVGFPAEVQLYHGTGLISHVIKIDIYGNKLNYQLGNRSEDPLPE
jgi:predicted DNA-binding protein with PD1-like motif